MEQTGSRKPSWLQKSEETGDYKDELGNNYRDTFSIIFMFLLHQDSFVLCIGKALHLVETALSKAYISPVFLVYLAIGPIDVSGVSSSYLSLLFPPLTD